MSLNPFNESWNTHFTSASSKWFAKLPHEMCHNLNKDFPPWQGMTICGPNTEVKQLWAWLVLGWVTIWDTLVAAKDVIYACHVLLWLMSYEYTRGSQSVPELIKKAGVCTVMSMWLVHIKEHVSSIRTCPTTILLSTMIECVSECCIEGPNDKEVLPHMRW